jgi:hypothetical protein
MASMKSPAEGAVRLSRKARNVSSASKRYSTKDLKTTFFNPPVMVQRPQLEVSIRLDLSGFGG